MSKVGIVSIMAVLYQNYTGENMVIVSSLDLGNRYEEITDRFLEKEPIFVTKNGHVHSVLLGIYKYERMSKELLALKIDQGICEAREGKGSPWEESMERIKTELDL